MSKAPKQNMSGHITMDAQQAKFFQELNAKAHKLARMRDQGLLAAKPARNPLNAERSPRGEFKGFSFDPPPAHEETERWKYPENDWGLMAKFSSQKPIYDNIYERERKKKEVEEQVRKIKANNLIKITSELKKQRELFDSNKVSQDVLDQQYKQYEDSLENPYKYSQAHNYQQPKEDTDALLAIHYELDGGLSTGRKTGSGHRKGHHFSADHFLDPNHEKVNRSSAAAIASSTKDNLKMAERELFNKSKLSEFKISSIRSLQGDHPEIMNKMRCERAARYINKMNEKNTIRLGSAGSQPFRPPGSSTRVDSIKHITNGTVGGTDTAPSSDSIPISVLQAELSATEQKIERQKLKIGLQGGGTKSYQTAKTSRRMS